MTTFTMQDLTTTQEEEANMDQIQALTEKQMEQKQEHELAHQMVQGVTGAQYEVVDFNKAVDQQSNICQLIEQLTQTFNQLLVAITEQKQAQTQPSQGLQDAVDTVLQSADWFAEKVEEKIDEKVEDAVDNKDFEYEIGEHIERYFRNQFDISDHIDIDSEIERMIDNKLEEAIEDKLSNATISVNF